MNVTIKHVEGMAFEGIGQTGDITKISPSFVTTENLGASPMELVLMGVGSCSGIDIVGILEKMRVQYENFEIKVQGQRAEDHPRVFTDIKVVYQFWGDNLPETKIKRAVDLSFEKYCSVIHTVNKVAKVSYEIELNTKK